MVAAVSREVVDEGRVVRPRCDLLLAVLLDLEADGDVSRHQHRDVAVTIGTEADEVRRARCGVEDLLLHGGDIDIGEQIELLAIDTQLRHPHGFRMRLDPANRTIPRLFWLPSVDFGYPVRGDRSGRGLTARFSGVEVGVMETVHVSSKTDDEAAAALEPFFPGVDIGSSQAPRLQFELEAHQAASFGMIEYSLAGREIRANGGGEGLQVMQVDMRGEMLDRNEVIDTTQPFIFPGPSTAVFQTVHARVIELDLDAVNSFARIDLGNDDFQVARLGIAPLSAEAGRRWLAVSKFVAERMRDGSADLPLVGAALSDLVTSTFLNTFPTTWADARQRRDGTSAISTGVRRARLYVDENFRRPITSADIAESARLSLRGLREAFRRELGMTPLEYLRTARLAEARRSLLSSTAGDARTVAAVAAAAGFSHPSRFASAYRTQFGELPSRTLR